jgi:hypothetical protein
VSCRGRSQTKGESKNDMRSIELQPDGAAQLTAAETMRVFWAMQLAPNIDVCASLLRGELVDEAALDPDWLELALRLRVIGIRDALDHLFPNIVEPERRAA